MAQSEKWSEVLEWVKRNTFGHVEKIKSEEVVIKENVPSEIKITRRRGMPL